MARMTPEQHRNALSNIVRAAKAPPQEWPQLSDEEWARLVEMEPEDMDREIRRILSERAPDALRELDGDT